MDVELWLLVATTTGTGLMAGLFFTFSAFAMQAFDRLPPAQAIAAMQAINAAILNPLFFALFFGTALLSLALLLLGWQRGDIAGWLMVAGGLLYLAGSIAVTIWFNVPLNNQLAAFAQPFADAAQGWHAYRAPWSAWNHVRTVGCTIATASLALAIALR